MAINVTVFPVDGEAIVYFQDGSQQVLAEQETHNFQIVDNGFVTISDAPADEDLTGEKFVEMMIEFWEQLWAEIREEAEAPTATPL